MKIFDFSKPCFELHEYFLAFHLMPFVMSSDALDRSAKYTPEPGVAFPLYTDRGYVIYFENRKEAIYLECKMPMQVTANEVYYVF